MALSMRKRNHQPGELSPSEYVKSRKAELATARRQADDAQIALKRTQAKHEELVAAAERDEQAHVAELEQAREALAEALADGGDVDGARATLDELEQAAKRRRDEAGVLANILERRRHERSECNKAVRKAEKAYWLAVEKLELSKIPDLDALKRAYVACERASPMPLSGFDGYLSSLLGDMGHQDRARVYDDLERDYG